MTDLDRARNLCLAYAWMRQQLTEHQAKRYKAALTKLVRKEGRENYGLDEALLEAAKRIAQLEDR